MISEYFKDCPLKNKKINNIIYLECSKPNEKTISNNILIDDCVYYNIEGNYHHYTTKYLFDTIMPLLSKKLNINFNKDDFELYEYDEFSFHIPKNDFKIAAFSSNKDKLFGNSFLLRDINKSFLNTCPGTKTKYQTLFSFMHRCSDLINLETNSDRILLLNCDSMISPLIPILLKYFKEIIVLDNRTKVSYKCLYETKKITDYLCILQTPNIKIHKEEKNLI